MAIRGFLLSSTSISFSARGIPQIIFESDNGCKVRVL